MDKHTVPGYEPPANALRRWGLRKIPNFWIKEEDMPVVFALADKVKKEVREIQNETNTRNTMLIEQAEAQAHAEETPVQQFSEAALTIDWPGMN